MTGQDSWMASPTQWTWVWASSRIWWWTGKPGVLQSMGLQRVGHYWETEQQQYIYIYIWASQVALVVKNLLANAEDIRHAGLIPGSGRSPGVRNSNPLQYSYLENLMEGGDWQATVHTVTKSNTTEWLSTAQHSTYIPSLGKCLFGSFADFFNLDII